MLQNALKLAETSGTDKRAIAGTLSDIGSVVASQVRCFSVNRTQPNHVGLAADPSGNPARLCGSQGTMRRVRCSGALLFCSSDCNVVRLFSGWNVLALSSRT